MIPYWARNSAIVLAIPHTDITLLQIITLKLRARTRLRGYSTDFTVGKLDSLYPTHADYVSQVGKATQAALKAGYILPFDADTTIHEAEASRIGAR